MILDIDCLGYDSREVLQVGTYTDAGATGRMADSLAKQTGEVL